MILINVSCMELKVCDVFVLGTSGAGVPASSPYYFCDGTAGIWTTGASGDSCCAESHALCTKRPGWLEGGGWGGASWGYMSVSTFKSSLMTAIWQHKYDSHWQWQLFLFSEKKTPKQNTPLQTVMSMNLGGLPLKHTKIPINPTNLVTVSFTMCLDYSMYYFYISTFSIAFIFLWFALLTHLSAINVFTTIFQVHY